MRYLVIVLVLCMPYFGYAEIYKWVDKEGVPSFSDTPHEGATSIDLAPAQTYQAKPSVGSTNISQPTNAAADVKSKATASVSYKSVIINQPQDNATLRDNQGTVSVNVAIDPGLQPKDALIAVLDGVTNGQTLQQSAFVLTGINRGAHKLEVHIIGPDKKVVKTSAPITFYMQQVTMAKSHQ